MYDHTLDLAKRVADSNPFEARMVAADAGLDARDYEDRITKGAAEIRLPGESAQQAWVRYAETTPEGRALLKASLVAPTSKKPVQAAQNLPYEAVDGDATAELERLARQVAASSGLTYQQAYSRLLTHPSREKLRAQILAQEQDVTRRVRAARKPLDSAERASETRRWAGMDR
jgi:hypothetical protein